MFWIERQADRGSAVEFQVLYVIKLFQGGGQPCRQPLRNVARDVGNQHDELVAAGAPDDVMGPEARLDPLGGDDQQLVTDLVAILVVDLLEIVEVDKQQRAGRVVVGLRQQARGIGFEAAAIQYPGQRIAVGHRFHLLDLCLAVVCHVDEGHGNVLADRFTDDPHPV